jgi:hypothetical protein
MHFHSFIFCFPCLYICVAVKIRDKKAYFNFKHHMEGEVGDTSRASLLGSDNSLSPLGQHVSNSMDDVMEETIVDGPVQNLDQFFTRVW